LLGGCNATFFTAARNRCHKCIDEVAAPAICRYARFLGAGPSACFSTTGALSGRLTATVFVSRLHDSQDLLFGSQPILHRQSVRTTGRLPHQKREIPNTLLYAFGPLGDSVTDDIVAPI